MVALSSSADGLYTSSLASFNTTATGPVWWRLLLEGVSCRGGVYVNSAAIGSATNSANKNSGIGFVFKMDQDQSAMRYTKLVLSIGSRQPD